MSRASYILAIMIEGIGQAISTDRQTRFSTSDYDGDADAAYLDVLSDWPEAIDADVDFRRGSASVGGQTFQLLADDEVVRLFIRMQPPAFIATLASEIPDSTDPDITVNLASGVSSSDLQGLHVLTEREVIRLSNTVSGAGPYTYTGSSRGRWATRPTAHKTDRRNGTLPDPQIFRASEFPVRLHRAVSFIRVPEGGADYTVEEVLWRGVLRAIDMEDMETITLHCDDLLELVRAKRLLTRLFTARRDRAGSSNFSGDGAPLTINGASFTHTGLFSLDGKTAALVTWVGDLDPWPTRAELYIDPQDGDTTTMLAGAPALSAEDFDSVEEVWEIFSNHPDAPDLNTNGGSTNTRLSNNRIDLVRQILTTSDADSWGEKGPNGDWDLGRAELGCAIDENLLDTDSFDEVKNRLGDKALIEGLFLGLDKEPIGALDLIERILQPIRCALVPRSEGKLGIAQQLSSGDGTETTFTEEDLTEDEPALLMNIDSPVDRVVAIYDERPGRLPIEQPFDDHIHSRRHPSAERGEERLDMRGVGGRGFERARQQALSLSLEWFSRFRQSVSELRLALRPEASAVVLSGGDIVKLTHGVIPKVNPPASGSSRGLTAMTCQVVGKTYDVDEHVVDLALEVVGALHAKTGLIAPSARVAALNGSAAVDVDNTFSASLMPNQTDDTFGILATYKVEIWSRDRTTSRGTAVVNNVSGGTITFDSRPAGTAVGDIIEFQVYDNVVSDQAETFAFMADSNDQLGAGNDAAYEWVDG